MAICLQKLLFVVIIDHGCFAYLHGDYAPSNTLLFHALLYFAGANMGCGKGRDCIGTLLVD